MIREILLPALQERFGDRDHQIDEPPQPFVVFFASNSEVGDLSICDEGEEATVYIGEITHCHFNPYDPSLSPEQIANVVSDEVLDFLNDLFRDRVLLWKSRDGHSGGCRILGDDEDLSLMETDDLAYVWSGPIKKSLEK